MGVKTLIDVYTIFMWLIPLSLSLYSVYNIILLKSKNVDLKYTSNTFEAESSFSTQFHFFNKGNVPATDIKIRLKYPKGTEIMRISPSMKFNESENRSGKIVELHIQRIASDMPIGFLILSEFEPIGNPEILYHEQKAVQSVTKAQMNN